MSKRSQPHWVCPSLSEKATLKLYNSLTREKEVFIPQFGNKVLWYSCGPTVYDASHMGHARSYISFDILRRVLSEYFSYDVFYVMNITDIDDKIIKRARQKYLYEEYVKNHSDIKKIISDVQEAIKNYETVLEATSDKDKKTMIENLIERTKNAVDVANSLNKPGSDEAKIVGDLLKQSVDVMSEWQDKVNSEVEYDNSIFFSLPAEWEEEFYTDMESLNVLQPDAVTRVTEFIPEIIEYVKKIIDNGFAYESNGSVYFDTIKFDDMPDHFYGKLVPEAFGDLKKLQEGEGELSIGTERLNEKRSQSDFAVWKSSKPGEPSWDSPWGKGRPGWHIECSVMASSLLGESMDIHTGGYDLKFPHHDNELAQSEAYFGNDCWVRYFLHSGHLTISGCKMSKSLKNFITIKEALKQHTSRQIRLAFLLHSWKDTLDYSSQTMDIALYYEKLFTEFLLTAKDSIRDIPRTGREAHQKWTVEEHNLFSTFQQKQAGVHESLCDNIDTRSALENIRDLITASNIYISSRKSKQLQCNRKVLANIMSYITKILKMFGANFGDFSSEFTSGDSALVNQDDIVMPYLRTLADFRENIRQQAIEIKAVPILKLCDSLRDDVLPALGVRLEDQEGLKAAIKLVDPAVLAKEKEIKQRMDEEKRKEKERKKQEQEALKAEREAAKRKPPSEMFKSMTDKYSKFDDKGIPTHDVDGKELSESQTKKVMKLYTAQEKKYNDYLKSVATS
ncbi:cysteine--tRNA ligase, cytoplasmic [Parasteatoda tepidariorum]|uniref:cysteine--tRNA ligase, cytoplasmic n=1 Tax=Parasteatoda tepidariorum TaxID=114398 RepID=UPI001C71ED33|nr:cysteine--tRNA ligase, cytoplasmic [Parasteatoda tepidariorum]